jgi:hypothetical protein
MTQKEREKVRFIDYQITQVALLIDILDKVSSIEYKVRRAAIQPLDDERMRLVAVKEAILEK